MPKRKQQAVFFPLFLDIDGKQTFAYYRMEEVEVEVEENGEKIKKLTQQPVMNKPVLDSHGEQRTGPINRAARRIRIAMARRRARKPVVRVLAKPETKTAVTFPNGSEVIFSDSNSEKLTGISFETVQAFADKINQT